MDVWDKITPMIAHTDKTITVVPIVYVMISQRMPELVLEGVVAAVAGEPEPVLAAGC